MTNEALAQHIVDHVVDRIRDGNHLAVVPAVKRYSLAQEVKEILERYRRQPEGVDYVPVCIIESRFSEKGTPHCELCTPDGKFKLFRHHNQLKRELEALRAEYPDMQIEDRRGWKFQRELD